MVYPPQPPVSRTLGAFLRDEAGMNYSMQMTIALPFYVLLIAVFIDLTLLLNTKTGVQQAATAAARAATVWWPADDLGGDLEEINERRMGRIHLAAVNALAPFASGAKEHAGRLSGDFEYPSEAPVAWARSIHSAGDEHEADYLARKWAYAAAATRVFVEPLRPDSEDEEPLTESEDAQTFNSALKVTVEYRMPFQTPGAGRLFGDAQGGRFFTKTIRSTVVLEKEGSKAANHRLGFRDYYEVREEEQDFRSENAADEAEDEDGIAA